MAPAADQVRMLQCEVDQEGESYFRFLVNKHIKYLIIDEGVIDVDDMCFGPALISSLPAFPEGDWNEAKVSKHTVTGKPYFAETSRKDLPSVTAIWHPECIEYVDLAIVKKLRSGVYEVTAPCFPRPVIAKFARFEWEIDYIDRETEAYRWLEGCEIGPRFLGHLAEEGRVMGYLMERVEDAQHASPTDFEACQRALGKLHALGILHGDVNKHNFLVQDGVATLIDFECAQQVEDQALLREEMSSLLQHLEDVSGRGGSQVEVADDKVSDSA